LDQGGKQAAVGALIGQVMKQVKGADPAGVRELMLELVSKAFFGCSRTELVGKIYQKDIHPLRPAGDDTRRGPKQGCCSRPGRN
jgi:hypothetical protein